MKTFAISFLKKLAKNNNREWFAENKNLYQQAQADVIEFVEQLIAETGKFEPEIRKTDAKKSLFRIYRDTRFSADKTPYKTNFGSSLGMRRGNKTSGFYLHIEPGKSFLACGLYQPDPVLLKKTRREISENGEEFLNIINQKDFKKHLKSLDESDKLKKIPQGFEKDDPMAEFIKLKNFMVIYPISDADLHNENAAKSFAAIFKIMKPLNDFLNAVE